MKIYSHIWFKTEITVFCAHNGHSCAFFSKPAFALNISCHPHRTCSRQSFLHTFHTICHHFWRTCQEIVSKINLNVASVHISKIFGTRISSSMYLQMPEHTNCACFRPTLSSCRLFHVTICWLNQVVENVAGGLTKYLAPQGLLTLPSILKESLM